MVNCVHNLQLCHLEFKSVTYKNLVLKDAQCSETDFLVHEFFFCALHSFRDVVDFVFNVRSEPDSETLTSDSR